MDLWMVAPMDFYQRELEYKDYQFTTAKKYLGEKIRLTLLLEVYGW
jgi:hypothetical protein